MTQIALTIVLVPAVLALWVGVMLAFFLYVVAPAAGLIERLQQHPRVEQVRNSRIKRLLDEVAWGE